MTDCNCRGVHVPPVVATTTRDIAGVEQPLCEDCARDLDKRTADIEAKNAAADAQREADWRAYGR